MKWKKLGMIFSPEALVSRPDWMVSHAALPFACSLGNNLFRIYFSARNQANQSSVGFVEIHIHNPGKILSISEKSVLKPGEPGLFDDSGTSLAQIIQKKDQLLMYYLGWNLAVTVPFRNSIGLATANKNTMQFEKKYQVPILDRNIHDPFALSYPWVLYDEGRYRMWYGSNLSWGESGCDMMHVIKYSESKDGVCWKNSGYICINFKNSAEYAFSRPCVIKDKDCYRMWYSYRGDSYRIGYAESFDGLIWARKDNEVGIDVSPEGWDSEMIEYPHVFDHSGRRYMLYNGNSYGKTGFGLAILED